MNDRYEPVRLALPTVLPPITRLEAERAATRLYRHFGALSDGRVFRPSTYKGKILPRRCWTSTKPTWGHHKGWGRLVHDTSHEVFRFQYPTKQPHDPLHARWEADFAEYVASNDWLQGGLKPPAKAKPTKEEARTKKIASVEARMKAWETKLKRTTTALRKLRAQSSRLHKA